MDTTYCSNCKATLKEGAKFCTKCGTPVKEIALEKEWNNTDMAIEEKKINYYSKKIMIIGGLIAIVAIFLIGKSFISNADISEPLFDIDEEVERIEGNWHDPSGVILKDKTAIISFRSVGSIAEGKDDKSIIKISLIPIDKNKYFGVVLLDEIKGEFDVTYYSEEGKLVFFSTLTKTSWNIKKLNK